MASRGRSGRATGRGRGRDYEPRSGPSSTSVWSSRGRDVPGQSRQPASHSQQEVPPPSTSSSVLQVQQLGREMEEKFSLHRPDSGPLPPKRPGFGKIGMTCYVKANHFIVEVADKDFFQYNVNIAPEVASKGVCRAIISELVRLYGESHLGKRTPAYDGRKSLYTAGPLPFKSKEFVVLLSEKDGGASSSKRGDREFKVTLKYASQLDMYHLRQFLQGVQSDNNPQDIIQVLDTVLRHMPSSNYTVVGRSFFHPSLCISDDPRSGRGDLSDGLEYWRGYYQSLRPTQLGLSLNIDLSARAFFDPILVTEFVQKHFYRDMSRPLSDQDRIKVKKALRGVKVHLVHLQHSRSYKITGISNRPASQTMFTLDDKKTTISVAQYFHEKYDVIVKHPNLPCLQAGSDSKPIYLPMEFCKIVEGQRYTKKLNEKQVTNLLRATCQRPNERENGIQKIFKANKFKEVPIVNEFGMTISSELARVPARVLPAPILNYHPSGKEVIVDPRMGQWNMINKKMINGARVDAWACINFSTKLNRNVPYDFCNELVSMCNSKGMAFNPRPILDIKFANPNQIEKALTEVHKESMKELASNNCPHKQLQLLIIILPDMGGSYGRIKRMCETELGIISQCCQPRQAVKMQKQYCENVSLKINVKIGGRNSVLDAAVHKKIPFLTDKVTIVFGADVTHPQPGDDSSPSIAAVVASMDWPEVTKYRCLISAQSHREEIIEDLYKRDPNEQGSVHKSMIMDHLKAFRRSTGLKPDRIIFYRDGVSEGQFSQVLLYEVDAIRKACASLQPGYLPPITFVVVQKRHHTRFFPENNRRDMMDRSGNILPGTVVDRGICHPSEFDFFLNSHAGIQGTSRPAHYHVLYDENNFTADGLQMLTNSLCYTYARCTRAVSLVPPAYYAHLAAFRARYYIEGDGSDSGSSSGSHRIQEGVAQLRHLPAVKDNVMNVMFFC
ncbi:hypothetical protein SAY86_010246 [Trapa natans]|uniref:Protein argonaute 7 n=1 Tax=Trapa natans TaxID=22666 RepID=A0AAN7L5Y4_TRANT|nr:hypothetical protein SAY86_010246 [Trapa natans]